MTFQSTKSTQLNVDPTDVTSFHSYHRNEMGKAYAFQTAENRNTIDPAQVTVDNQLEWQIEYSVRILLTWLFMIFITLQFSEKAIMSEWSNTFAAELFFHA